MFRPALSPQLPNSSKTNKFLNKQSQHTSSFGNFCCLNAQVDSFLMLRIKEQIPRQKISIKQLMRKGGESVLENRSKSGSRSKSKTKTTKNSYKTSIKGLKNVTLKHSKSGIILPYQIQTVRNKTQLENKSIPNEFIKQNQGTIRNFHTTNYIVGQCIVQPEETNIIVEKNEKCNVSIEEEFNSIFDSKIDKNMKEQLSSFNFSRLQQRQSAKQFEKQFIKQGKINKELPGDLRQMACFSFGHRQKKEVIGKYFNLIGNGTASDKNRNLQKKGEQELYKLDPTISEDIEKMKVQLSQKQFLRETFQKQTLNYLVNKVGKQIYQSQSQRSQSKQSMVIDTYKSIAQRLSSQHSHSIQVHSEL